jgi:outer membrane protein insertion porin family
MNASRPVACTSVFVLTLLAALFLNLRAQQLKPPTISYEGQKISSVELAGRPDLNVRELKQLVRQTQDAPYSQQKIDETIAALKKTGQFTDVQLDVRPQSNGLEVLFVLQPAVYFGVFDFGKASRVFSYNRLLQIADYPNQEPYTAGRVEEAESNLLTYFHQTGFFLATIEPQLQTDQAHGIVNVLFDINLKRRAKFGNIVLTGASEEETSRLQHTLHSLMARLRGASLRSGKTYSFPKLQKATNYLQAELGKQHYLAGRVQLISALYNPQTNRADVTFKVTQGPQIAVKIEGGHVWGRTQKKLIPIYQENAVDPDLVQEGSRNLVSHFQSHGYFHVKVHSRMDPQPSGTSIVYQIDKGPKGKVESIAIHGNQKFDDDDLAPHLAIAKKHFLSRGKFSDQLLHKSVKNLEAVYENAGYSQVKVTPTVTEQQGNISIVFQVDEGVQDVVNSLKIEGNKTVPETELAPGGLNLAPGKPYSTQLLNKDRDQIMAFYLKHGYLTANFKSTTKPLKQDPHRVEVVYSIDEGPKVQTAMVQIVGAHHTRPEIISKHANIKVGQPLSEETLLQSESKLYTLGVFDWASVDPQRPITTESDAEVLIKLHEAKRNSITYGVGFEVVNRGGSVPSGTVALPNLPPVGLPSSFKTSQQTFWGPRGSLEYSRLNFRGRAETLTIGGLAARLDQRAAISWTNPSFWNSVWTTNLTISAEHSSENPIFTEKLSQVGYQFQRTLDAKKTQTLFLRYSLRRTNLSNLLIPGLVGPEDVRERLSTFSASYIRDTRDNSLDAHRGLYESAEFDINPSVLGSNTNFGRFLGQTAYYRRLGGNNIVWANSLRLGLESAFSGDHVPLSEKFFSGGGSTLRGFPLYGAGPQRDVPVCSNPSDPSTCAHINVPVGGAQLVVLNSELRFPIPLTLPLIGNGLGGVAFYDGGNVYNSIGVQNLLSDYTNTLGFGLRYATPIGPIRLDIGHRLTAIPGVKATQIFITVGQAF